MGHAKCRLCTLAFYKERKAIVHFQVVERQVDPAYLAGWESVSAGFVDEGWHDTVLVMLGEQIRVLLRFTEPGMFLYHCHNLEHGDGGMMRNMLVT